MISTNYKVSFHAQLLKNIINASNEIVFAKDLNGTYRYVNKVFCNEFKVKKDDIIGETDFYPFPSEIAEQIIQNDKRIILSRSHEIVEEAIISHNKEAIFRINKAPLINEKGYVYGICGIGCNITVQKKLEDEKEILIQKLKEALKEIDKLKEILPICSYCKKIRDDKGYWEQVEVFIHNHSHIDFSHGICPDCFKKYFSDLGD